MGKESFGQSFSKAVITKEDDEYILTEYNKDETKVYMLNKILDSLLDIEGLSITIKRDREIPSEE